MNKADIRLHSIQKWSLVGLPFGFMFTPSDVGDFERLAGMFLVVAVVVLLGLVVEKLSNRSFADARVVTDSTAVGAEKSCSACFETIKFEAVKCRHCGTNFGNRLSPALVFTSLLLSSFVACSQWAADISSSVQSVDDRLDSLRMSDVDSISSQIDSISSDVSSMSSEVSDISSTLHDIDSNTAR
jgi:hypothetical protein